MYKFKTALAFTEVFCGIADKIEKQSFEKKGPLENGLFFLCLFDSIDCHLS